MYSRVSKAWKNSIAFTKDGLRKYSEWIGEYPYTVASVVQGGINETSGGMEYPTITLITTQEGGHELDATIAHEVGHNWFYGALASNERDHPWMDEGMNTYYHKRYEDEKYKLLAEPKNKKGLLNNKLPADCGYSELRVEKLTCLSPSK
jgi:aminopeptidase N